MNDALNAGRAGLDPMVLDAITGVRGDIDAPDQQLALPTEHPAWQRDVLSISARTRALLVALRPIVVKVLTFWDHQLRDIRIGASTLGVDPSGSYRLR